ncbi:MAG: multicopper oxidase domain-containing protein [Sulfobacillus sp.]
MKTKLVLPLLLEPRNSDEIRIVIFNARHKFASDAQFSGTHVRTQPIFGSRVFVNGKKVSESSYGLPFMRFARGSAPRITYENATQFTFNIHYHGLNTVGSVDGTSMEVVFGPSTLLGPTVTFQFPEITNNQSLLWFHSHNMFVSMELIYGGIVGLLDITDKETRWLSERFKYGDNHLMLEVLDMDLDADGAQTSANLPTDENRSCFAVVNGVSAVSWSAETEFGKPDVPFVDSLCHTTTRNLVKIDILNASLNWRVFHLGVCDKEKRIRKFQLVQNDGGLMNPSELEMVFVPVAGRVGIVIDLNQFKDHVAYLFFYDYDLTEVFDSVPTCPEEPNDPSITGTVPEFSLPNATPYPTPIPDPLRENQQQDYTNLNYPHIGLVPQVQEVLEGGSIPPPRKGRIKAFLKIKNKCGRGEMSMDYVLSRVRKTVFGKDNYSANKELFKTPCFEYQSKYNYTSFLNRRYYYNLPESECRPTSGSQVSDHPFAPVRNLFLFPETGTNAIAGGNANGTTEYVNGANRIMVDLWNSAQLNLEWALQEYSRAPNNYKPPVLPSSTFRIYRTNDTYSNTAMISNDTLTVELYDQSIAYGDFSATPVGTVSLVFSPTPECQLMNVQQWIDLVNRTFAQTRVILPGGETYLGSLLSCDWCFFPYAMDMMYEKTLYLKSAAIKTINGSGYWIRMLARWPLLQFFGKPMTGNTLDRGGGLMSHLQRKQSQKPRASRDASALPSPDPVKNPSLYIKCDEVGTYGIYDSEIQQIFPFYGTNDGNVQLPIACMKRNAELIVNPQQTYVGLYDGYLNDNLNSFSVALRSSETWVYTNGDNADAHPIHFHLTSGFCQPSDSSAVANCRRPYDPLLYSRDIYQVGPQQSVSFRLTWPHYSSYERTDTPNPKCVGGVIHCHFLQHNDANSMIIQYFVGSAESEPAKTPKVPDRLQNAVPVERQGVRQASACPGNSEGNSIVPGTVDEIQNEERKCCCRHEAT